MTTESLREGDFERKKKKKRKEKTERKERKENYGSVLILQRWHRAKRKCGDRRGSATLRFGAKSLETQVKPT